MKLKRILVILAGVLSCSASQAVVLGEVETDSTYRVTVRASNMAEFPICGGTLVAEQWVLTAAHCVVMGEGIDESTYYVTMPGELAITAQAYDLNNSQIENYYSVSHVVVHPNYTRISKYQENSDRSHTLVQTGLDSDIALLYLDRPVTGAAISPLATPADMASIESRLSAEWNANDATNSREKNVTVSGWGTTTPLAQIASPLLLKTTSTFLPISDCYQRLEEGYDLPGIIDSPVNVTKLCTVPNEVRVLNHDDRTQYGNSACKGDSGGPLVDNFTQKQIGIVSGAPLILPTCGSITIPSFFTKVSTYYSWIKQYTDAPNPPVNVITSPNFITASNGGNGGDEPCYDGIATNNCNFRDPDGGAFHILWALVCIPIAYLRRRNKTS